MRRAFAMNGERASVISALTGWPTTTLRCAAAPLLWPSISGAGTREYQSRFARGHLLEEELVVGQQGRVGAATFERGRTCRSGNWTPCVRVGAVCHGRRHCEQGRAHLERNERDRRGPSRSFARLIRLKLNTRAISPFALSWWRYYDFGLFRWSQGQTVVAGECAYDDLICLGSSVHVRALIFSARRIWRPKQAAPLSPRCVSSTRPNPLRLPRTLSIRSPFGPFLLTLLPVPL